MGVSGLALGAWLARTALGGGAILLLTLAVMKRCRQPARQQRFGELGLVGAVLLAMLSSGPAWLVVPLLPSQRADPVALSHGRANDAVLAAGLPLEIPSETNATALETDGDKTAQRAVSVTPPSNDHPRTPQLEVSSEPAIVLAPPLRSASPESLLNGLTLLYATAAMLLLGRWLAGHFALRRILRHSRAAPENLALLFSRMAEGLQPCPRLLVSKRLGVPMSCGIWRPTVVIPHSLCEAGAANAVRWVFAHELTHLERRDAWACVLFGIAQALYFYVPWFWSVRRRVRLCQEYIADAAAAREAADPEDYAEFLLSFTPAPAVPLGTTGVFGNSSDLFRRITMLLQSPRSLEKRCPRAWSLAAAGGLLAVAVLVSGLSVQAQAAPARDDTGVAVAPVPDKQKANPLAKKDEAAKKDKLPGLDPRDDAAQMRDQVMQMREEMMKRMPQMGQQGMMMGGGMMGFGMNSGRLGVMVKSPDETLVEQLDLPKGKGLVVTHIQPNAAAARAGIKPHDILLEFDGKTVSNDGNRFANVISDMKADTAMDAVVLRKGKKETIKGIKLPEAAAVMQGFPNMPRMQQGGFPGIQGGQGFGIQGAQGFLRPIAPAQPGVGGEGGVQGNLPPMPQAGAVPGFGFGGGLGQGGGNTHTVMTTNFRSGNNFTTRHQEGSLIITITGTVEDGKEKVADIKVQDGGESSKYPNVDKVPAEYRDKVKNLIETNEKSNTRIELKTNPAEKKP